MSLSLTKTIPNAILGPAAYLTYKTTLHIIKDYYGWIII